MVFGCFSFAAAEIDPELIKAAQEEGELILRVQGSTLEVFLPGKNEPVYTLNDATPYSHGLCGLYSTGKEFAVTELSVRPVKE